MKTSPAASISIEPPAKVSQTLLPLHLVFVRWYRLYRLLDEGAPGKTRSKDKRCHAESWARTEMDSAVVDRVEERLLAPLTLKQRERLHKLLEIIAESNPREH